MTKARQAHRRRMLRADINRYHRRAHRNAMSKADRESAFGKSKWCNKCAAALVCMARGRPDAITRCTKCNLRYATWYGHQSLWDDDGGVAKVAVTGIKRCPGISVPTVKGCDACTNVPF